MANNNIMSFNEKNQLHGYYERYWYNGNLWYKGHYINGERTGFWEIYHINGEIYEEIFYVKKLVRLLYYFLQRLSFL